MSDKQLAEMQRLGEVIRSGVPLPGRGRKTGMKPEPPQADAKCPACGAPAKLVADPVLRETTAWLTCGCYGGVGDFPLADAVAPRPAIPPCPGCGVVEVRLWLAALGRWRYSRDCLPACACPDCMASRAAVERAREETEARGRLAMTEDLDRRLRLAEIPRAYQHCEIATYESLPEVAEGYEQVMAYAARLDEHLRAGRGLWFIGPTGTGKTHLAVAVLRMAISTGWRGLYRWTRDYLRDLRASYSDRDLDPLPRLVEAPVLVLDDVGEARLDRNPEHVREALIDVLGRRHMEMRPTLITSNQTHAELREIDERISSRLAEMCEEVVLKGPDYRLRGEG